MNTPPKPNQFAATHHMHTRQGLPVPDVEPLERNEPIKRMTFVCTRTPNDPLEPLDVDPATSAALTAVWEQAERDVAQILRDAGQRSEGGKIND